MIELLNNGGGALIALLREDERDNKSVQSESLRKDEDKNHTYEKPFLLTNGSHSSISYDSNGHTGSQTTKAEKL